MHIPSAIRGPLLSLILVLLCILIYWIYFQVLAPYTNQRSQDRLDELVEQINAEGFTANYCARFNNLSKTYAGSYLSDKMAFKLKNQILQEFPRHMTPEEALAFMNNRLYSLDLHFETIFNFAERKEAGRSPNPHKLQHAHRRQFMTSLAVLVETFSKAHTLKMKAVGDQSREGREIAAQQVLYIVDGLDGEVDMDGVGEMIRPLFLSIERASAGLLAFDVIDVEFPRILRDLNYLMVQGFKKVDRSPFEFDLRKIVNLDQKSPEDYGPVFGKIIDVCEAVATPGEFGLKQKVILLGRACERTIDIATLKDLHSADVDDDLAFARSMRARMPHKGLWVGGIEQGLQSFWSSPTLKKYMIERVQEFPEVFGAKTESLASLPGDMVTWFREQPAQMDPDRVSDYLNRIQTVLNAELENDVAIIQQRYQDYQRPDPLHFTPGTAKQAYKDKLDDLKLVTNIQLGSQSIQDCSMRDLRRAYQLLKALQPQG
jgi:hypothetical protein